METSRDRIIKTVNHIEPEIAPVYIMGFEEIKRWLEFLQVKDYIGILDKLGLDIQAVYPVYTGRTKEGFSIWGVIENVCGYQGRGYSSSRNDYPLAGAACVKDIEEKEG